MPGQELNIIPARRGAVARVRRGQTVRVVKTHGDQVVDVWRSTPRTWPSICPWSIPGPAF